MIGVSKYREQKIANTKLDTERYEHNLKLLYDSMKTELSTLYSDKVNQSNLIKILMWLNIIFVGISIKIIENGSNIYILLIFYSVAFLGILFSLVALMMGRYSVYASMRRTSEIAKISNNKWTRVQGVLTMIYVTQRAIRYNGINIVKRAKWIRSVMYLTVASLFLLLVLSVHTIYKKQETQMAEEKKPTQPVIKPTKSIKRANDSMTVRPIASDNKTQKK